MAETIKTILTADSSNFRSEFAKASAHLAEWKKTALGVGTAVAGMLGGRQLIAGFNNLRESIDKLDKGARRLEMAPEDFQRLSAVANMAGTSVDALSKALNRSRIAAGEAVGGSAALDAQFKALGISAGSFLAMSPTERLLSISNGFNNATDKAAAFNAVFKLMGKSAQELIPLLRDGEAGIEAISRKLKVIGGADVAAVAQMNDELELMTTNLKTELTGSLLVLRPQIESFVSGLSAAAEGLSIFFSKAGSVGLQGGELGGAAILREIDELNERADKIKNKNQSLPSFIPAQVFMPMAGGMVVDELRRINETVGALRARYAELGEEAKIFAEQTNAFERLRGSGMGEDALRAEMEVIQSRTAESLRTLAAERELAVAAGSAAAEMENQHEATAKLAGTLETIQQKVSGRILNLQSPEVRRDTAQAGLSEILKSEKVGSVDQLRLKVGSTSNPEERTKLLQSLDNALDRMEEIKRASTEIQSRDTERFNSWAAQMEKEKEARDQLNESAKAHSLKAAAQKSAREEFDAESAALKAELNGRKDIAERIREEVRLRSESLTLSERLGVSEVEALKLLRERASEERKIKQLREKIEPLNTPGNSGRPSRIGIRPSRIGRDPNPPGNNLKIWKWNMTPDMPRIGNPRPLRQGKSRLTSEIPRIGNPRPLGQSPTAGVRFTELNRRSGERNVGNSSNRLIQVVDKHLSGSSSFQESVLKLLGGIGLA
jgi:hypothetical protein